MTRRPVGLLSGFPHEETGSWLEKLLIPLIHFILLGFLPLGRMRLSKSPAFAAGCGQLFIAQRSAYESAGGHAAIRSSLHDGILLPRAFRRAGQTTDVFDATNLAECRMYRSAKEVWLGLLKNAGEGMASPVRHCAVDDRSCPGTGSPAVPGRLAGPVRTGRRAIEMDSRSQRRRDGDQSRNPIRRRSAVSAALDQRPSASPGYRSPARNPVGIIDSSLDGQEADLEGPILRLNSTVLEGLGEELADRSFEKAQKDRNMTSGVDHALVKAEIDLEPRAGQPRGRTVIRPDDLVDKHPEFRLGLGDALLEVRSSGIIALAVLE